MSLFKSTKTEYFRTGDIVFDTRKGGVEDRMNRVRGWHSSTTIDATLEGFVINVKPKPYEVVSANTVTFAQSRLPMANVSFETGYLCDDYKFFKARINSTSVTEYTKGKDNSDRGIIRVTKQEEEYPTNWELSTKKITTAKVTTKQSWS